MNEHDDGYYGFPFLVTPFGYWTAVLAGWSAVLLIVMVFATKC